MAKQNKSTYNSQFADMINRDEPYDSNPLIQKIEALALSEQETENTIFEVPTVASISNPSSSITLDFESVDLYNINTTGSGSTAFNIAIGNLAGNATGKISITKKTNDTIGFTNATLLPFETPRFQEGTSIDFTIINISDKFYATPQIITIKDPEPPLWEDLLLPNAMTDGYSIQSINAQANIDDWGYVRLRGSVVVDKTSTLESPRSIWLFKLPSSNYISEVARRVPVTQYFSFSAPVPQLQEGDRLTSLNISVGLVDVRTMFSWTGLLDQTGASDFPYLTAGIGLHTFYLDGAGWQS